MKRTSRAVAFGVLAVSGLVSSRAARAQETEGGSGPLGSLLGSATASVWMQGGRLGYDPVPQLPGLGGRFVGAIGITVFPGGRIPAGAFGVDFQAWGLSRSYDSVIQGADEPRTSLDTRAFALGVRAGLPRTSPVGAYVLAGATYVDHVMKVKMQPAWFLPGLPNSREEEGGGWAPYWGLAADVRVGSFGVGVEQRWVRTEASFDEYFSMSDLALGGSTLLVGVTWFLGR